MATICGCAARAMPLKLADVDAAPSRGFVEAAAGGAAAERSSVPADVRGRRRCRSRSRRRRRWPQRGERPSLVQQRVGQTESARWCMRSTWSMSARPPASSGVAALVPPTASHGVALLVLMQSPGGGAEDRVAGDDVGEQGDVGHRAAVLADRAASGRGRRKMLARSAAAGRAGLLGGVVPHHLRDDLVGAHRARCWCRRRRSPTTMKPDS